jgi:hypothetical protein
MAVVPTPIIKRISLKVITLLKGNLRGKMLNTTARSMNKMPTFINLNAGFVNINSVLQKRQGRFNLLVKTLVYFKLSSKGILFLHAGHIMILLP